MNNEQIYDEQIAPELLRLASICQKHGMSFIACVEYDAPNSGIGRTEFQMPDQSGKLSAAQRIVHWAARCKGNIDSLFVACDRHGQEHGHSSIYLSMAGNKNIKQDGNECAALTVAEQ